MRKLFEKTGDRFADLARKLCGKISPDRRIWVIIVLFCLFALVNIWVMSSAIFNIGRESSRIEQVVLPDGETPAEEVLTEPDSLQLELEKFFNEQFNTEEDDGTEE